MARVPFPFAGGVFSTKGMELPMGVHAEENKEARVVQKNASQYFLLNSLDRFQTSSTSFTAIYNPQAWNDFKLQKPGALMNAFAERIDITEIRFPWFIPNINQNNNTFWIEPAGAGSYTKFTVPVGFYTPAELVSTVNGLFNTAFGLSNLVLSYDNANQIYTLTAQGAMASFTMDSKDPTYPISAYQYYITQPSFLKTLGFQFDQMGIIQTDVSGLPTNSVYTDYIDITSSRLMMNTDVQDGNSANEASKPSVVCRVYLADESSQVTSAPLGSRPMLIHRQFVTPKATKWSRDQFIDWLDIQVYDMYGQLAPLPTYVTFDGEGELPKVGAYPDFQITCLASEN